MIKLMQTCHLLVDAPDLRFVFVKHLDRNFEVRVVDALREKHLPKCAVSDLLSCGVDNIVLLQLVETLLLICLARFHI